MRRPFLMFLVKIILSVLFLMVFSVNSYSQTEFIKKEKSKIEEQGLTVESLSRKALSVKESIKNSEEQDNLQDEIIILSDDGTQKVIIINSQIKNELLNSREQRDMLTALPGFKSLSIDNEGVKVCILNEYVDAYISKYLIHPQAK